MGRAVHAQDADQACQESRHSHCLWQNNQSEGSSRTEDCEGVLRCCPEEEHLKKSFVLLISFGWHRVIFTELKYQVRGTSSRCGAIYVCRAPEPLSWMLLTSLMKDETSMKKK